MAPIAALPGLLVTPQEDGSFSIRCWLCTDRNEAREFIRLSVEAEELASSLRLFAEDPEEFFSRFLGWPGVRVQPPKQELSLDDLDL
jgi:hypothetical protein